MQDARRNEAIELFVRYDQSRSQSCDRHYSPVLGGKILSSYARVPVFDGFEECTKCVSPTSPVYSDHTGYCVPAGLRFYPDRVAVATEGQVICELFKHL